MATSSLLGIDPENIPSDHRSTGIDSLGPSDASDSGSDSAGVYNTDSDTDRFGTGERSSVEPANPRADGDILPDHVESIDRNDDATRRESGAPSAEELPSTEPDDDDDPLDEAV